MQVSFYRKPRVNDAASEYLVEPLNQDHFLESFGLQQTADELEIVLSLDGDEGVAHG
jgi:hypothetical protein